MALNIVEIVGILAGTSIPAILYWRFRSPITGELIELEYRSRELSNKTGYKDRTFFGSVYIKNRRHGELRIEALSLRVGQMGPLTQPMDLKLEATQGKTVAFEIEVPGYGENPPNGAQFKLEVQPTFGKARTFRGIFPKRKPKAPDPIEVGNLRLSFEDIRRRKGYAGSPHNLQFTLLVDLKNLRDEMFTIINCILTLNGDRMDWTRGRTRQHLDLGPFAVLENEEFAFVPHFPEETPAADGDFELVLVPMPVDGLKPIVVRGQYSAASNSVGRPQDS